MLAFGIQNINQSFFLTSKPLNILRCTLFVFCLPLNTLVLLFFSAQVVIASAAQILLHFHRKKHHFRAFVLVLWFNYWPYLVLTLRLLNNKHPVPCSFFWQSPKMQFVRFRQNLKSKNITGTLSLVWLSLKLFFLPFSSIFTWKWINHTYLVAVYTLNTPSTSYFHVYNR